MITTRLIELGHSLKASGSDATPPKDDNHAANIQEMQKAKYRMLGGVCRND